MPLYDYRCRGCHAVKEEFLPADDGRTLSCECCGSMERQFPFAAVLGYQPFEAYYDEALDCDITGREHRKFVMRAKNVIEKGDRVHGARNFDKHAPHHVKPLPPRGVGFSTQEIEQRQRLKENPLPFSHAPDNSFGGLSNGE